MTRKTTLALLVVVAALHPGVVAAKDTHDDGVIGNLLDGEDDGTDWSAWARSAYGAARGRLAAASDWVGGLIGDEERAPPAERIATDVQTFVNDNSSDFVAFANGRLTPADRYDVVAVEFDVNGESATRYVIGEHNASQWTGVTVANNTDRTIDESCTLDGDAATSALAELRTLYRESIEPDEDVPAELVGRLSGQYIAEVDCSFGVVS